MNSEAKTGGYTNSKIRIYWSIIITVLSLILAFLLLQTPTLILRYFASTLIITTLVFILKRRYFYSRIRENYKDATEGDSEAPSSWKPVILLFLVMIIVLVFPLFLAGFLDSYTWFIFIISLTSGISISEVALYVYLKSQ